jgi:hypothetical protein
MLLEKVSLIRANEELDKANLPTEDMQARVQSGEMDGKLRAMLPHGLLAEIELERRPGLLRGSRVGTAYPFCALAQALEGSLAAIELPLQHSKCIAQLRPMRSRRPCWVGINILTNALQENRKQFARISHRSRLFDEGVECLVDDFCVFRESVQGLAKIPGGLCDLSACGGHAEYRGWIHQCSVGTRSSIRSRS